MYYDIGQAVGRVIQDRRSTRSHAGLLDAEHTDAVRDWCVGYARVSTTEQNPGLRHDDLETVFDASLDPTEARKATVRRFGR